MNDPIDQADMHPSWRDDPDPPSFFGIENASPEKWQKWVVALEFHKDGSPNKGSGFYINLPSSRYSIILTAAHNLVSDTGRPVTKLKILSPDTSSFDIPIPDEQIRVSESYTKKPGPSNRAGDWGALLRPYDANQGGFGFAVNMGIVGEFGSGSVFVTAGAPERRTKSGGIKGVRKAVMKYDVKTITGNSGAPVWMAYKGHETAVGIHNYGAEDIKNPNAYGQGTRLNLEVYRELCTWADLGWSSKAVRASQPGAPALGLYLRFSKGFPYARVRLGPEELETAFDIMPGLTRPGNLDDKTLQYVFLFKEPAFWNEDSEDSGTGNAAGATTQFVRWNADPYRSQVSLASTFREDCLVKLLKKPQGYEIICKYGEVLWKLRMQMNQIPMPTSAEEREGFWNFYESSEVGFVKGRERAKDVPYVLFAFE